MDSTGCELYPHRPDLKRVPTLASVAQLVGASSHKPNGGMFDFRSGHMPRLRFNPQSGHVPEGNQSMFLSLSFSLFLSLPLSLKAI